MSNTMIVLTGMKFVGDDGTESYGFVIYNDELEAFDLGLSREEIPTDNLELLRRTIRKGRGYCTCLMECAETAGLQINGRWYSANELAPIFAEDEKEPEARHPLCPRCNGDDLVYLHRAGALIEAHCQTCSLDMTEKPEYTGDRTRPANPGPFKPGEVECGTNDTIYRCPQCGTSDHLYQQVTYDTRIDITGEVEGIELFSGQAHSDVKCRSCGYEAGTEAFESRAKRCPECSSSGRPEDFDT